MSEFLKNYYVSSLRDNRKLGVLLWSKTGEFVTQLGENDPVIWPLDENGKSTGLSARYEHAAGIILTIDDAKKLGLEIQHDN